MATAAPARSWCGVSGGIVKWPRGCASGAGEMQIRFHERTVAPQRKRFLERRKPYSPGRVGPISAMPNHSISGYSYL